MFLQQLKKFLINIQNKCFTIIQRIFLLLNKQEYQREAIIRNRYKEQALLRNNSRIEKVQNRMSEAIKEWVKQNNNLR